jgi:phosphotransferase system  glucose/maltose/N-acetylglucosamine-specific IIC component
MVLLTLPLGVDHSKSPYTTATAHPVPQQWRDHPAPQGCDTFPFVRISRIRLRNFAAILATLTGVSQAASLWFLPTTPVLLATALCGTFYLVLALGLFGISRFSLFIGAVIPVVRVWFGLWPLPIEAWEWLRIIAEVSLAAGCAVLVWVSLHPEFEIARAESEAMEREKRAKASA